MNKNPKTMESTPTPKKCHACGKSPEMFWMAVDGYMFCNVSCYALYQNESAKGVKRFEA